MARTKITPRNMKNCPFCEEKYDSDAALLEHIRRKHSVKKYRCEECAYSTDRTGDFKKHQERLHGRERSPLKESDRQYSNEHLSMSSSVACKSLSVIKPTTSGEAPIPTLVMPTPISPFRTPRRGLTIAGEAERCQVSVACQTEVEPQVRIRRQTEDKETIRADGTKHKIRRTLRVEEWAEPLPVQPCDQECACRCHNSWKEGQRNDDGPLY